MLDGRWRTKAEGGLRPIGAGLDRAGIRADHVTVLGLLFSLGSAVLVGSGRLSYGALALAACGVCDMLDGAIAKASGRAGPRGAFLDSVSDRVSDALLFGGVAWHLGGESSRLPVLAMAVLALSLLISYERARAESLGFDARGGLMERAERIVLLGIGLVFGVLIPVLWLMVALTALTAVHRFAKVWRQASPERPLALRRSRVRRGDVVSGTVPSRRLRQWWKARRPAGTARWRSRLHGRARPHTRP